MDYIKIHNSIIANAKSRKSINGYFETHHILPRCMGGDNSEGNLVKLTAREHFLVHRLLTLIYPDNNSLVYAYWAMCGIKKKYRYVPSAKVYEHVKIAMSKATKERLSKFNSWKGRKHTENSKNKQRNSAMNRNISKEREEERRLKISTTMKTLDRSENWCSNISKSKEGANNPMFGKTGDLHPNSIPVQRYSLDDELLDEWSNARQAAEILGLNYKSINACLRGVNKTSGGFKWKVKQK